MYAYCCPIGRPEKPPSPRPDPEPVHAYVPKGDKKGSSIF